MLPLIKLQQKTTNIARGILLYPFSVSTYFLTFLIDRHGKELKSVSGVIKKKEAYSRYGNIYYLKLRRKKFQVSHELYEKIESDQQYTFYYINNYLIDIIFSWEKL